MDIECGPEQAGWLRDLGLEDLRVDHMTIPSLHDAETFAVPAEQRLGEGNPSPRAFPPHERSRV